MANDKVICDEVVLRVKDHPEANGRSPLVGEHGFTLLFPLEDGRDLKVLCGRETINHFQGFLAELMIDEHVEREDGGAV